MLNTQATIAEAILKEPGLSDQKIIQRVRSEGLEVLKPLGFANNYMVVVFRERAEKYNLTKTIAIA